MCSDLGHNLLSWQELSSATLHNPALHIKKLELNRFAVGVAAAVSSRGALPTHNPYVVSELY